MEGPETEPLSPDLCIAGMVSVTGMLFPFAQASGRQNRVSYDTVVSLNLELGGKKAIYSIFDLGNYY